VLLIAAAGLTALVQAYWVSAPGDPDPVPVAEPVRRADPAPRVEAAPPPAPRPPPPPEPAPAPVEPPRASPEPSAQAAFPSPAPQRAAPDPAPEPTVSAEPPAAAPITPGAQALPVVDLNTGTLAELNNLQGGGAIGRAIIQRRPYSSVDQLLSRRVLSRATYERIKDQVTVR
jgi:outer membrane biosynthesis protein TonB